MFKSFLFSLCLLYSLPILSCDDSKGKTPIEELNVSMSIPPEPAQPPKPKPVSPLFDCADTTASAFIGLINAFAYLDTAAQNTGKGIHSFQKFANGK